MVTKKESGDLGEVEVCKLTLLPPMYPLVDLQCTRCVFRVQVKSTSAKPGKEIFGAGWEMYDKVFKAGYLPPPLMINYKWREKDKTRQQIHFFPFMPQANAKKVLTPNHKTRAGYKMFNYVGLDTLPHFVFYDA